MSQPDLAQQAIDYLVQHDLVLPWDFDPANPPPEEVKRLLQPYLGDGEIERTTGALLCDYLVGELREDCLPRKERSRRLAPQSRPATCRVVRGDD